MRVSFAALVLFLAPVAAAATLPSAGLAAASVRPAAGIQLRSTATMSLPRILASPHLSSKPGRGAAACTRLKRVSI